MGYEALPTGKLFPTTVRSFLLLSSGLGQVPEPVAGGRLTVFTLPAEIFWMRKCLRTPFLAKAWYNAEENLKPYEPHISGDVRYFANSFFRLFRTFVKSDYQLHHVCPPVRPHGTTHLPLDEFAWNFVFEYFSKIRRENSSFIKIGQE